MQENISTTHDHNGNASEIYKSFHLAYTVNLRGAFATQPILDHRSE